MIIIKIVNLSNIYAIYLSITIYSKNLMFNSPAIYFHGGIGCIGTTTLNGARAATLVMTSNNPTSGNK